MGNSCWGDKQAEDEPPPIDSPDFSPLTPCVICESVFPSNTEYHQVNAGNVKLYYINNRDAITHTENWKKNAGAKLSAKPEATIGGEKGGTSSHTEKFLKTVVGADIHGTDENRLFMVEGMRCVACLCSLSGILLEKDRIKVDNTVGNILSSNELQLKEEIHVQQEVRIGLRVAKDLPEERSRNKYLSCGGNGLDLSLTPYFTGNEIWLLSTTRHGDGRLLLKSQWASTQSTNPNKEYFLSGGKGKDTKVCMMGFEGENPDFKLECSWKMKVAADTHEYMGHRQALPFPVKLQIDASGASPGDRYTRKYLFARKNKNGGYEKVEAIEEEEGVPGSSEWVVVFSLPGKSSKEDPTAKSA